MSEHPSCYRIDTVDGQKMDPWWVKSENLSAGIWGFTHHSGLCQGPLLSITYCLKKLQQTSKLYALLIKTPQETPVGPSILNVLF